MIVRIFDTSVDPGDVERGKQLFRDEVRPVFLNFPGCHDIEMVISVEEHSGDFVQIAAISRWEDMQSIEAATKTEEYATALTELRRLFAQSPIVRHFETMD